MNDRPHNLMTHLVANEPGVSALLATLLEPNIGHPLRTAFIARFRDRLAAAGVTLTEMNPSRVLCEQEGLDLLLAWSDWLIVIENKVAAASITRGQLNRYYQRLIRKASKQEVLGIPPGKAQIAMVFLTPTPGIGGTEFASLELNIDRQDSKLHISWSDLLDWINDYPAGQPIEPFELLVRHGCECVKAILDSRTTPKTEDTPNRQGMRQLLVEVKRNTQTTLSTDGSLVFNDWKDPYGDSANVAIDNRNVNLWVRLIADESDCGTPDAIDSPIYMGFKVAIKSPAELKSWFQQVDFDRLAEVLDIPSHAIELDREKWSFEFCRSHQGDLKQISHKVAQEFVRLLSLVDTMVRLHHHGS